MNRIIAIILATCITYNATAKEPDVYTIVSPGKTTALEIKAAQGKFLYRMLFQGALVTNWSRLGLQTDQHADSSTVTIEGKKQGSHNEKIHWPLGEDELIINNFNEIRLSCKTGAFSFYILARVYDGSIAFRYELPAAARVTGIKQELTEFNFTASYTLYQYHHESVFTPVSIDTFNTPCDLPATLTDGKIYISVGEAFNINYTKAELKRGGIPNSLAVAFIRDSSIAVAGPFNTPWRTISVSKTAIGLHAFSQLYIKLNPAAAAGVPQWIKPGKLIRAQLNTQSGLDCIDFASKHNFQYIMFDAGWYGAEFRSSSDPTQVIPQIDMPKVIAYGKEKGIGVILYVNYVGLKAKLDTILPLYKKWGVAGMKFGFVDGFTQQGLSWLHDAIKKVNDHGFVLNIHDNYKPTGLSRTYPALLTQEGIRGDENSPDAFHNTTLPFTRFLAGPADFTFCYPNAKNKFAKNLKVSMGQQLALTVVYFSPLQAIFWYGQPNDYTNEGEIEFFKHVPTVWNESHYLAGDIGKNISVARRSGDTWFIGNATGLDPWNTTISLDFLSKEKNYTATIYEDDDKESIRKRVVEVKKGDQLPISLAAKTGNAIIIEPAAAAQKRDHIQPGETWPDTEGNHIQAHGGGIIRLDDTYYWYGEQRRQGLDTNFRYVSCYSSKDLMNWTFKGDVLKLSDPENLGNRWVLERPKVFYNQKTKKYVMYFHLDNRTYRFARVGVAVCDKADGNFQYVNSFRPLGYESRDIGQFIDDDGSAYLIFESRPSKGFYIAALSADYLNVEKEIAFIKSPLEGGAIVHYKGLYYAIGSALTGWRPNPNKYATATSLAGPWSEFEDIAPPHTNTYGSQSTMLLKVTGTKKTTIIFLADQWKPGTQWDSRYLWMPVEIGEGKLWVPEPRPWRLNIKKGDWKYIK